LVGGSQLVRVWLALAFRVGTGMLCGGVHMLCTVSSQTLPEHIQLCVLVCRCNGSARPATHVHTLCHTPQKITVHTHTQRPTSPKLFLRRQPTHNPSHTVSNTFQHSRHTFVCPPRTQCSHRNTVRYGRHDAAERSLIAIASSLARAYHAPPCEIHSPLDCHCNSGVNSQHGRGGIRLYTRPY
jgi:hypothetical protein